MRRPEGLNASLCGEVRPARNLLRLWIKTSASTPTVKAARDVQAGGCTLWLYLPKRLVTTSSLQAPLEYP